MSDENEILEEEIEVEEEDTLSTALEAAWEASEVEDEPDELATEAPAAVEPVAEAPTAEAPAEEAPQAAPDGNAAPVGLPPEAREAWKDTPPAVQKALAKREADFANGIKHYAEQAKRADGMDKSLAPYSQFFAMNGGVGAVLPSLLQTGSMLQMGSPQQKAESIAGLIKQFGVDVRALDNFLVGAAPPPGQQQQTEFNQAMDARLAPMQQQLQYYQQRDQQQAQSEQQVVANEVSAFSTDPKNEFYNDLRSDMADIMDMSANRGVKLTMQEAYDKAAMLNPTINQILLSRQGQQNVDGKRRAASSIHGGPGGSGGGQAHDTMRSAIEDAWDNAGKV
jgi:hypothetical protein